MLKVHFHDPLQFSSHLIKHMPENHAVVKDEMLEKIKSIYSENLGENSPKPDQNYFVENNNQKPKSNDLGEIKLKLDSNYFVGENPLKTKEVEEYKEDQNVKKDSEVKTTKDKMVNQIIYSSRTLPFQQKILSNDFSTKEKKKNGCRCFSFKIKTKKNFKKSNENILKLKFNEEKKFFEISDEYVTNFINVENIISTYLNIKGIISENEGYYILIKKTFFIGDMLNENSEIFNTYLVELVKMLENFNIFDYKPYTNDSDDLKYIEKIITELYQITIRKINELSDARLLNSLAFSCINSFTKFKDDIKKYAEINQQANTTTYETTKTPEKEKETSSSESSQTTSPKSEKHSEEKEEENSEENSSYSRESREIPEKYPLSPKVENSYIQDSDQEIGKHHLSPKFENSENQNYENQDSEEEIVKKSLYPTFDDIVKPIDKKIDYQDSDQEMEKHPLFPIVEVPKKEDIEKQELPEYREFELSDTKKDQEPDLPNSVEIPETKMPFVESSISTDIE